MCSRGPWCRQPGTVISNRSTAILIKTHTVTREDVTAAVETRGQHCLLEINAQPITEQLQTSLRLKRKFFVPQMKNRVRRLPERPFELGIDTPPELRKKPGVYDVQGLGNNYRMTDFQAALGLGQIERYPKNLSSRKKNAKLYCEKLKNVKGISFLDYSESSSYFLFQIILLICWIKTLIGRMQRI